MKIMINRSQKKMIGRKAIFLTKKLIKLKIKYKKNKFSKKVKIIAIKITLIITNTIRIIII